MFVEFLLDLLSFFLKFVIIIGVISIPVALVVSLVAKEKKAMLNGGNIEKGRLVIIDLKKAAKKRKKLIKQHLKSSNPDNILSKKEKAAGLKKGITAETDAIELAESESANAEAAAQEGTTQDESAVENTAKQENAAQFVAEGDKVEAAESAKTSDKASENVTPESDKVTESDKTAKSEKVTESDKAAKSEKETDSDKSAKSAEALAQSESAADAVKVEATENKDAAAQAVDTKVAETSAANVNAEVKTEGTVGGDAKAAAVEGCDESGSRCPFKRAVAKVTSRVKVGAKKKENRNKLKAKVESQLDERQKLVSDLTAERDSGVFCPQNLYVLDFNGSTSGEEVKELRLKIDAILDVATSADEVIINLTSPGGMVNSYGLCASQLQRLRDHGVFLTVTVDEVAASGGYLMACVANKIVAAPFAYIGSIGVIAGIPNFRKVLKKYDVDYEQITAGKYKRTLSVLGENTEEGRQKFKEELEAIHKRFKDQVFHYRPQLDLEKVTTGEHWLAADALELGLVDELATSDEYIAKRMAKTFDSALKVCWCKPKDKNFLGKIVPKVEFSGFGIKEAKEQLNKIEEESFLNMR